MISGPQVSLPLHDTYIKMPAPSELKKRTQVVQRLVDEEKSYRKELATDEEKIQKQEADSSNADDNAEFLLKQLVSKQPTLADS